LSYRQRIEHPRPPRSPDLNSVDYYFWGMLKARVYHQFIPTTMHPIKERITQEINNVSVEEMCRTVHNLEIRSERVLNAMNEK
jgi:hypothetical protein